MTAIRMQIPPNLGPARPARVALGTIVLLLSVLIMPERGRSADPPVPTEGMAGYLEWYKRNVAMKPADAEAGSPTPEDIRRFKEWYKRNGAPRPPGSSDVPQPEEVVRYLEWYKRNGAPEAKLLDDTPPAPELVARYVDWFKRNGAPSPIASPAPQALPTVTAIDVKPIHDGAARPEGAWRAVPPPPLRPFGMPVVQVAATVETAPPPPLPPILSEPPSKQIQGPPLPASPLDDMLAQAGCSTCGTAGGTIGSGGSSFGNMPQPPGGCACGSGNCVPGRLHNCSPCEADTVIGRFACGIYQCICCPDPCYEGKWIPLADAAFFTESARPQTQQRLRWDAGLGLNDVDIAEYFWARADGKGMGPNPSNHPNTSGYLGENSVKYSELSVYTEAALGNIGAFVEMPYRSLDGEVVGHAAGFGDINLGTKTLLFDCELLQIAFEFRTFVPSGEASKGLGTGHVSLEPGLIIGLKLGPDTYFQGQLSEWIPIGGDPDYQGALLEYHMSVNQLICRILPDVPLVGTAELNGWSFQHGQFTDSIEGPDQRATGITYISMGPGLRLFICDKIDFGLGTAFAVTSGHFADQLFRSEFRWRF